MNKVVLILAMLLSGCATRFMHTTQAPADFDRELYGCQRDAAPVQDRARSTDMIERCMAIKGWRKDGFAWGFNRYAPITAYPSGQAADHVVPPGKRAFGAGPVDASREARSAIGATKTYGEGVAASPGMRPNEAAPTGAATAWPTVRKGWFALQRDESFDVYHREASSLRIDD